MKLTRNFTLQELIKSDTAIRKGINNNPNAGQIEKLKVNIYIYIIMCITLYEWQHEKIFK